jgi:hypothetical protein
MKPTKGRKTHDPFDLGAQSPAALMSNDRQQLNTTGSESPEPRVWRTLGRMLHESIIFLLFIGLNWITRWILTKTGQEHEWWAIYISYVLIISATLVITVMAGIELIAGCKRAFKFIKRLFKEKKNEEREKNE